MRDNLKNILIVEDDLSLYPLWESVFSQVSPRAHIEWAVSSESALKLIEGADDNTFDLIVADLFLAGSGTGIDLLSSQIVKTLNTKKILVSSTEEEKLAEHFYENTVLSDTKILSKPLNVKKCKNLIHKMCD